MSIKMKVKMTDQVMYDFLLYHNYTHINGLLSTMLGIVCLGIAINSGLKGDSSGAIMLGAVAFVLVLMEPINLKNTAKRQVKNTEMFEKPLMYELSDEGLSVKQNGKKELNKWENFAKVVSTNKSLIVYVTRVRAIILPKEAMGDDYMAVVEMISTHMPAKKVKIRHVK